ncbi:cytochrome c oxidase assembly protein [Acuticoccus yangtzensis]|uniref:cytochrome c oxidase assembly protein n=1 Tax=Acuticoccus yangtzensis TaxID=1443441 RepID=UPI0009F7FAB1|nr:cytochrome c oxidase assembly protein [Acuticoccus yangtzensis]ORE92935.1 cytochrome C oxidase assembly protein [Stappia sp. 22II-S9-Z10]
MNAPGDPETRDQASGTGRTGGSRRHAKVALACTAFVSIMVGAAFASVPLYDLFCRVTGFDGTPSVASIEAVPGLKVGEREVTIRFDSNIQSDLPWTFTPSQRTMKVHVGEVVTAEYEITNLTDEYTVGRAAYNVTPFQGGGYFTKVDCFCFTAQPLEPNETRKIPVVFYVDPAFDEDPDAKGVHVITLSYTFYKAGSES